MYISARIALLLSLLGGVSQVSQAKELVMAPIVGKVMTVRGPVMPRDLGITLMHEHLLMDQTVPDDTAGGWAMVGRTRPVSADDIALYNALVQMGNLGELAMGAANRDNWLLTDKALAQKELQIYKQSGGGAVVDATSLGLKRDPKGLRLLSETTGLHVVMGSSWYGKGWYEPWMSEASTQDLADRIVRDLMVGADDTDIRAGIIGEVGVGGWPLADDELKVVRASAQASRATGAAILLKAALQPNDLHSVLDVIQAERADLSRVIVSGANAFAGDAGALKRLLDRRVWIAFDQLGQQPTVRTKWLDTDVARAIVSLIKEGYANRLLLSHDVQSKTRLTTYGGAGYAFIQDYYVGFLKGIGVADEYIHQILVENPGRVLAFDGPIAAGQGRP